VPETNHVNILYRRGRNGARRRHTFAVETMTLANQDVPSNDDAQVKWGFAHIAPEIRTRLIPLPTVRPPASSHTPSTHVPGQQGFRARCRTEVHPGTWRAVHSAAGSQNTCSVSWDSSRDPAQRSAFKACCDVFFPLLQTFLYPLFVTPRYLLPTQFANFPL
jgi:hypothetical protein